MLKINVDGSYILEIGEGALAFVCHDCHGTLVDGCARSVTVSSAIQAEAMAIPETLKYFVSFSEVKLRELKLELETDQFDLVAARIGTADQASWVVTTLITEAQAHMKKFNHLHIAHCKREIINSCAGFLDHCEVTLLVRLAAPHLLSLQALPTEATRVELRHL